MNGRGVVMPGSDPDRCRRCCRTSPGQKAAFISRESMHRHLPAGCRARLNQATASPEKSRTCLHNAAQRAPGNAMRQTVRFVLLVAICIVYATASCYKSMEFQLGGVSEPHSFWTDCR